MKNDCIKITLFGNFTITYHDETLKLTGQMGKQLLNLLELLIYYRNNTSSRDIIVNALWADNDNPANAMKYAIFRLRSFLKNIRFLKDLELITTGSKGYELNPEYDYYIDTEIFDKNYQSIKAIKFHGECLPLSIEMLNLYNGDIFTLDASETPWIQQANVYYRTIYQNMVNYLCNYYLNEKQSNMVYSIASKATVLIPDFEGAHAWYLRALLKDGEIDKALEYYRTTVKMLNDVYDHAQSEELRALYPSIILHDKKAVTINALQKQLSSSIMNEGAFFCEYDVFEYMYQNIVRSQSRTHEVYFLLLFDLLSCPENQEIRLMDKLSSSISRSLRFSDVYTRINKVQTAVLLQSKNEEGAHIAAQRVLKDFHKRSLRKVKIAYYVTPI